MGGGFGEGGRGVNIQWSSCRGVLETHFPSASEGPRHPEGSSRARQGILALRLPVAPFQQQDARGEFPDALLPARLLQGSFDYASRFAFANRLAQFRMTSMPVTSKTTTSKIETNKRRQAKSLAPSARLRSAHYCCLGNSISSPVPWPACTLGSWPFHLST